MVMMVIKIFYLENKETHIATGEILEEDATFITIEDRYDGKLRIGKSFIIKIKDVMSDGCK